ncbi:hypothetical protein B296_00057627 [Ensete ventricosum]|uniref:Uncharacterized protein n=1 Tax=Ensete ventricosum TaxID=4639 RepID=A0A426X487_ENSVE|nr:hypothetical protein B296_00057627 [Ensete ventricosum]
MLAVESLRGSNGDDRDGTLGNFPVSDDFGDEAFLEDVDFGDLFMGIDDGDVLPDLELDPAEIFAAFSVGEEGSGKATAVEGAEGALGGDGATRDVVVLEKEMGEEEKGVKSHREEVVGATTSEDSMVMPSELRSESPDGDKGRKPSSPSATRGSQGKRKSKVSGVPVLAPYVGVLLWGERCASRANLLLSSHVADGCVAGGLDAGAAPEIRAGGGAAGYRQSGTLQDFRAHGDRLPHPTQYC